MEEYRKTGIDTYGNRCEICGNSMIEVHHISYQEQWALEKKIRETLKKSGDIEDLLNKAKEKGYLQWDGNQLEKDNRSTNLAVLCGNCHSLIHKLDAGMNLLNALTPRK